MAVGSVLWRVSGRGLVAAVMGMCGALAAQAADQNLTIGVYPYPPLGYAENGRQTGYGFDIVNEAVRRAGFTSDLEAFPVMRAVAMLRDQPNLLIIATKTPETVARYDAHWPFCFETVTHALMLKRDSPYERLEDIPRNIPIGAFLGYTLKTYLTDLGFTDLQFASENGQVADMLMHGRVDAWASFASSAYFLLAAKGVSEGAVKSIPIQRFPFCAMVSRNTGPEILARLQSAYLSMEADGTRAAIRARYERFLGPDLPHQAIPTGQ